RPWEILILKLEGRYDHSTAPVFNTSTVLTDGTPGKAKDQFLVVLGAEAAFRGEPDARSDLRRRHRRLSPPAPPSPSSFSSSPRPMSAAATGCWRTASHELRRAPGQRRRGDAHRLPRLRAPPRGALLGEAAVTLAAWGQLALFIAVVLLPTRPLGAYMHRVFETDRRPLPRVLAPVERFLFRLSGVDPDQEQTWVRYTGSLLVFSLLGLLVTYAILR